MAADVKDINTLQKSETLVHTVMGVDSARPANREQALGQELRRLARQENPREGTEMLVQRGNQSLEDMMVAVDTNISVSDVVKNKGERKRDPGSTEETRFNAAQEHARLSYELLDKGYDRMSDADQRMARDRVKVAVQSVWPEAATAFSGLSADKVDRMMETFLRDPEFSKAMGEYFTKLQKERIPQVPSELQKKFVDAEDGFKDLDAKRRLVRKELEEAETIHEDFQKTTRGSEGGKLRSLGTLSDAQHEVTTLSADFERYTVQKSNAERVLSQITALRSSGRPLSAEEQAYVNTEPRIRADIADANTHLATIEPDLKNVRQKAEEIGRLEAKKKQALEDITRLRREYSELTLKRKKAEDEKYIAQADLDQAQMDQVRAEQKFIDDLENLYARSAEDILQGRLEKAEDARLELIKQAGEEGFALKLRDRWNITEKGKVKLDKDMIKSDFKDLLDVRGGPREVVVKLLMDQPQSMTEAQAREYIVQNPDKVKDMEKDVTVALMSKVIQKGSGVRLNEEHVRVIQESGWGDGVLLDALNRNTEKDAELQELHARGLLHKNMWKEGMIKALPKVALNLLLLALTGVISWGMLADMNVIPGLGKTLENARESLS